MRRRQKKPLKEGGGTDEIGYYEDPAKNDVDLRERFYEDDPRGVLGRIKELNISVMGSRKEYDYGYVVFKDFETHPTEHEQDSHFVNFYKVDWDGFGSKTGRRRAYYSPYDPSTLYSGMVKPGESIRSEEGWYHKWAKEKLTDLGLDRVSGLGRAGAAAAGVSRGFTKVKRWGQRKSLEDYPYKIFHVQKGAWQERPNDKMFTGKTYNFNLFNAMQPDPKEELKKWLTAHNFHSNSHTVNPLESAEEPLESAEEPLGSVEEIADLIFDKNEMCLLDLHKAARGKKWDKIDATIMEANMGEKEEFRFRATLVSDNIGKDYLYTKRVTEIGKFLNEHNLPSRAREYLYDYWETLAVNGVKSPAWRILKHDVDDWFGDEQAEKEFIDKNEFIEELGKLLARPYGLWETPGVEAGDEGDEGDAGVAGDAGGVKDVRDAEGEKGAVILGDVEDAAAPPAELANSGKILNSRKVAGGVEYWFKYRDENRPREWVDESQVSPEQIAKYKKDRAERNSRKLTDA